MFKESEVEGRLRLFRFEIVIVVVTSFFVSIIAPIVFTANLPDEHQMGMLDALLPATIIALIAGLVGFMIYFAYSQALQPHEEA